MPKIQFCLPPALSIYLHRTVLWVVGIILLWSEVLGPHILESQKKYRMFAWILSPFLRDMTLEEFLQNVFWNFKGFK